MHSLFSILVTSVSLLLTKPFSKDNLFYMRRSFIPKVLTPENSHFSYSYEAKNGQKVFVHLWYEAHEFDSSNNFLSTKKRYKYDYIKKSFDQNNKLIKQEKGSICC